MDPVQKKSLIAFADLEAADSVTANELISTLEGYAQGGLSISNEVVKILIDRTPLSDHDLLALRSAAQAGLNHPQRKHDLLHESAHYQSVINHVETTLGRRYADKLESSADDGFSDVDLGARE